MAGLLHKIMKRRMSQKVGNLLINWGSISCPRGTSPCLYFVLRRVKVVKPNSNCS